MQSCPAACTAGAQPKNDACAATHDPAEAKALVASFYGNRGPSLSGSARAGELAQMTPELARQVSQAIVVPGNNAAFMCKQDRPTAVTVGEVMRDGEDALVNVDASFSGRHRPIVVRVRLSDLKIAGWTCGVPFHTTLEAHDVVRDFYGTHGPYVADGAGYRVPDAMSTDLRQKIASVPITADHGDPLTCSRSEIADAVSVDPPVEAGDFAVTVARLRFGGSTTEVVVAVGLPDLKIHATMCAPFGDGGVWTR